MTTVHTRRQVLHTALAATAAWVVPRAQACEYFGPTLRITHPWTRATPAGAAYAVLGMRFDDVSEDEELLDVQTPVAQAVVYAPGGGAAGAPHAAATVPLPMRIPVGRETVLGQASLGDRTPHLRLLRLTQDLEVGRSYPLRLVFKQGGTVKALLNVDHARFF